MSVAARFVRSFILTLAALSPLAAAQSPSNPAPAASVPAAPQVVTVNPDGSADATTIQAALAAVADGGTIRVLPGVYRENGLLVDREITL
ncbi:MAG: hypothetical protein AAF907_03600, partial [Planctomycetota bacterium]